MNVITMVKKFNNLCYLIIVDEKEVCFCQSIVNGNLLLQHLRYIAKKALIG